MTVSRSESLAARLRAEYERILSAEEIRAHLAAPIGTVEREGVLSLVRWFRRRYPNPADRLAYVRRAYGRWQRASAKPHG